MITQNILHFSLALQHSKSSSQITMIHGWQSLKSEKTRSRITEHFQIARFITMKYSVVFIPESVTMTVVRREMPYN